MMAFLDIAARPVDRSAPAADLSNLLLPPARTLFYYALRGYAQATNRPNLGSPARDLWPHFIADCSPPDAWKQMREWAVIGLLDEPIDEVARETLAAAARRAFDNDNGNLRDRLRECLAALADRI